MSARRFRFSWRCNIQVPITPTASIPLFAAIADKIQTMDERDTLRYTLGLEIVTDLLKMHAAELVINQTAGSHSIKP